MKTQTVEMTSKDLKLAKIICMTMIFLSIGFFFISIQMNWYPLIFVATGVIGIIGSFIVNILIWWYHG